MILDTRPKYPNVRNYVLKLHRDASPARGRITGRLENMSSGRHVEFGSAGELIAWLVHDAGLACGDLRVPARRPEDLA